MKKRLTLPLLLPFFMITTCYGQLLSWTPNFPVDNDPATNIVITMDATKGNQGLLNYTPTSDVYVHIGLIDDSSATTSDWRYVKFTWGTTNAAAQATYIGSNKWTYTITGGIRSFFGVTNGVGIKKIAILFRNGSGGAVQRNADASDMYIPVYASSVLATRFTVPLMQPLYVPLPEPINTSVGNVMNFTAVASQSSTMKLYLNGTVIQTASNVTTISASPTLTQSGNNVAVAEANDGTGFKRDTISFFVSPGINVAPLPPGAKDGINYPSDNTKLTLVLFAPGKNRVSVIGDIPGSNWLEQSQYILNKTPDGNYWWITVSGLTPGTEYSFQYLVDGSLKIAEPYAEKILDPNNDGSISSTTYPALKPYPTGLTTGIVSIFQTAQTPYNWQVNSFTRPDKRKLVVYELLVRDYLAAHDWKTLRDTLNYLQNLGINAIEIMPFNEFEGNSSWGYNPDFYFAPDKYYGPANTLKAFIDSCHGRGIAVVMDMVLNHATGQSPFAQLYWNSITNQPAANNPWFNQTATHPFSVFNDFNHESLATRYLFSRVVEHWLQNYKMDGFRFDLSKGFTQFNSGNNVALWGQYDQSRVDIWKRYYDTLQLKSPGSYAILEHFADNSEEIVLSNYGMLLWGNLNDNYAQASMGYSGPSPSGNTWDFSQGIFTVRNWTQPYLVTYMESHDEERLMYKNEKYGNSFGSYTTRDTTTALKRIEQNAAFLFTIPGPKMIWEFGELGYDYSRCYLSTNGEGGDCDTKLNPKPIRWDYFQQTQRKRLYDIFSALIKLRFHPLYKDVFISNQVTQSLNGPFKWLQVLTDTSKLFVVGNFDVAPQTGSVTFPTPGTWWDYLNGNTITASGSAQNITLQPGEYHVYLNRNVVNTVLTALPFISLSQNLLSIKIHPNPIVKNGVATINLPETGNLRIELLNSFGQNVFNIYSGFKIKGEYNFDLNTGHLAPGPFASCTIKDKSGDGKNHCAITNRN